MDDSHPWREFPQSRRRPARPAGGAQRVTRAGRRVGLSQPAMSAALSRLRRHFDDDLLARVGGHYELTALGQVLLDRVSTADDLLERLFAGQADFDPARESREFRLLASDYAVAVFGVEPARVVHREAPGIRLRFVQTPTIVVDATDALLGTTDGLLMPHGVISDFPATDLYDDRWVFLAAEEHARVGDRLTREDLARLPRVTHQRTYDAPAVRQLGMLASSRAWRAPSTAPRVLHPGAGPAAPLPAPATALDARHHRAAPVVAAPHAAAFTGLLDARGRVRPPRPGPPGARGGPRHPGTARADRLAAPAPGPGWRCVRLPPDDRRRGRPALRLRGGGRTRARPMSRPRRRARPGWPPGPGCRRPGRRWSPARRSRRRWARRA